MSIPNAQAMVGDLSTFVRVRTDPDTLGHYAQDWTRLYPPRPSAVVFPDNATQTRQLVHYANRHRIALVPSGGRTGLSGGAVATRGEIVVSFERMNRILAFDAMEQSVTLEPGVITETVQQYARDRGLYYPVDFASRGSSQIGGNIATNAGGIKVIRYGLTRNWVTGLKVITGRGDLLDLNRGLVKNASGYDLRHLFIGSEGTLGVIVEATLQLTRQPPALHVMVLAVPELDAMMALFEALRDKLTLTAFELFSEPALQQVLHAGLRRPFDTVAPYYVLVEFESLSAKDLEAALAIFEHGAEQGWVSDGTIGQSEAQAARLWQLRENISESIARHMPYKNDLCVRISRVPAFLREVDTLLGREYPDFQVIWFGHIGDGNVHVNVLKPEALSPERFIDECQRVSELLFGVLQRYGGSISAEHGVGLTKKPYLHFTREATEVDYLRGLKQVFDPRGIMNPGKIFD